MINALLNDCIQIVIVLQHILFVLLFNRIILIFSLFFLTIYDFRFQSSKYMHIYCMF